MTDNTDSKPKLRGRGGPGRGGGRPKGSRNRSTIEREVRGQEIVDECLKRGITPLEYMLERMRTEFAFPEPTKAEFGDDPEAYSKAMEAWHSSKLAHDDRRMDAAKSAAPYVHPKLASIEHKGNITLAHELALAELE